MAFSDKLEAWFDENGRTLPWRGIDNPYFIWLSEIILQQTRIEQGYNYYIRFIEAFPTVESLAKASEEEVLRLWQGLGYYSRARNLHAAAQYIVDECGGHFPSTYEGILRLKGVGRYTAAAIASFAFRLPYPVIDGNVYRFIARLRGITTPIATDTAYSEFERLLLSLIDRRRPDRFNAALMDFGSIQCRPQPDCNLCPFADECEAHRTDRVGLLPIRAPKAKPQDRWFYYFELCFGNQIVLQQRTAHDIWRGLWQFPLLETTEPLDDSALAVHAATFLHDAFGLDKMTLTDSGNLIHHLTHRTIHARFLRAELLSLPIRMPENTRLVDPSERKKLPVSRLIDKYLHQL